MPNALPTFHCKTPRLSDAGEIVLSARPGCFLHSPISFYFGNVWSYCGACALTRQNDSGGLAQVLDGALPRSDGGKGAEKGTDRMSGLASYQRRCASPRSTNRAQGACQKLYRMGPEGQVLITGSTKAELYDPSTRRFLPAGTPVASQGGSTAKLLTNGKSCSRVQQTGIQGRATMPSLALRSFMTPRRASSVQPVRTIRRASQRREQGHRTGQYPQVAEPAIRRPSC